MLAELEPEAEVVSTPVTVEGDLAGVFEREVVSQRLWDGKPLPALEAAVGLNACVDEEVPEEDGRTCGGVHAQGTKVGFFLVSIQLVHGERQQWVAQVFHVGLRGARVPQFPHFFFFLLFLPLPDRWRYYSAQVAFGIWLSVGQSPRTDLNSNLCFRNSEIKHIANSIVSASDRHDNCGEGPLAVVVRTKPL